MYIFTIIINRIVKKSPSFIFSPAKFIEVILVEYKKEIQTILSKEDISG